MAVGLGAQRRGMVGRDQNAILAVALQRLVKRADDVAVDLFQGLHLGGRVAFVRGFVGRLDVNANQVHVASSASTA